MKRAARVLARLLLVVLLLAIGFLALTPMGRYIARAAWEEGRILARREPIKEMVRSPTADPLTRSKLQLVLDARAFAVDSVGLKAGESFTTFSQLTTDTLVTGDPLHSLHGTAALAARPPELVFCCIGVTRASARRDRRSAPPT